MTPTTDHRQGREEFPPGWLTLWLTLGAVVAAPVVLCGGGWLVYHLCTVGERKTEEMVAGDTRIELTRMTWDCETRRVVCTDPTTLRYFERLFRRPTNDSPHVTSSWQLKLEYAGGGADELPSSWGADCGHFVHGSGDSPRNHKVFRLTEPRPKHMDDLLNVLNGYQHSPDGNVFILSVDGVRWEHDPKLSR